MKLQWYTDSNSKKSDAEIEKELDRDCVAGETITVEEGTNSIEITVDQGIVPIETDRKSENKQNPENKTENVRYHAYRLRKALIMGEGSRAESILERLKVTYIMRDTILHIAVEAENDGSTVLHIAAIVGNKHAAEFLVKKNKELLRNKDHKGKEPLHKAYENMHLDTIEYLPKAVKDAHPDDEIGIGLLVNAISAKRHGLALELVEKFPMLSSKRDDVLVALAKTFPSELDYWETLVYPPSMFLMYYKHFHLSIFVLIWF
ncbi:putative ankyrin repeat-containing domain-containing protein [Helianthus anomalus]